MRRLVAVVALLAVVALVAGVALVATRGSSDGHDAGPTPVAPTGGPPATQAPSAALSRFYSQRLDWSDCGDGSECARLTVPLDYHDPTGRTIRLYVLEVPASGSRIGSLIVNPGGPGAAGSSYAAGRGAGTSGDG